jgi:altronate dehydratase
MSFLGYERQDGSVGIRNHVLVIPGGFLANKICDTVEHTRTIVTADSGSGRTSRDRETIARTLVGLGANPNVASVIVLSSGLGGGYPELKPERLAAKGLNWLTCPRKAAPFAPSRKVCSSPERWCSRRHGCDGSRLTSIGCRSA